jgi:hypothetical protein
MWKLHAVNTKLRQDKFSYYLERTAFLMIRCPVSCQLLISLQEIRMWWLYNIKWMCSKPSWTRSTSWQRTTSDHPFGGCHARCHTWVYSWSTICMYALFCIWPKAMLLVADHSFLVTQCWDIQVGTIPRRTKNFNYLEMSWHFSPQYR